MEHSNTPLEVLLLGALSGSESLPEVMHRETLMGFESVKVELASRPELDAATRNALLQDKVGAVSSIARISHLDSFDDVEVSDIKHFLRHFPEAAKDRAIAAHAKDPRPELESSILANCREHQFTPSDVKVLLSVTSKLCPLPQSVCELPTYEESYGASRKLAKLTSALGEEVARELCLDPETPPTGLSHLLLRPLPQDALEVALRRCLQEIHHSLPAFSPYRDFLWEVLQLHGRTTRLKPFKCPGDCPCSTQIEGSCYTQLRCIRLREDSSVTLTGLLWDGQDTEIAEDSAELLKQVSYALTHGVPLAYSHDSVIDALSDPTVPRPVLEEFAEAACQDHGTERNSFFNLLRFVPPAQFSDNPEILKAWRVHAPHELLQDCGYEPFGGPEKVAELLPEWRQRYGVAFLSPLVRCKPDRALLNALRLDDFRLLRSYAESETARAAEWSDALLEIASEELLPDERTALVTATLLTQKRWHDNTLGEVIAAVNAVVPRELAQVK